MTLTINTTPRGQALNAGAPRIQRMVVREGGTTRPTLLIRLVNWDDDEAWSEFVARYRPLIGLWCRCMRLDDETTDELCQRIWVQLARRMTSYQYDPSRKFRGWLRRLVHSRAVDLLRERKASLSRLPEEEPAEPTRLSADTADDEALSDGPFLRLAQEVHEMVKRQVAPQTWNAFWSIAVEELTVRETATALNMSYAAAFAAHKRVLARLRAEGERLRANGLVDRGARQGNGGMGRC
jgi:RNA polymerase sigma factor (sigma-70 family)